MICGMQGTANRLPPVSYTHLDVYKRQEEEARRQAKEEAEEKERARLEAAAAAKKPVAVAFSEFGTAMRTAPFNFSDGSSRLSARAADSPYRVITVSYTHLDVYKRQALSLL